MHRGLKDRAQHRVARAGQAIVDPQSVASVRHQARPFQIREMARRGRLRNPQTLVDVAHADLTGTKQTQWSGRRVL